MTAKEKEESRQAMKDSSDALLKRECDALLSEISRLEMARGMQNKRVKNVMNLVSVHEHWGQLADLIAYNSAVWVIDLCNGQHCGQSTCAGLVRDSCAG